MKSLAILLLSCSVAVASVNEAVMTGTNTQVIAGQKVFTATGSQTTPFVAFSQSGASAGVVTQDVHFDHPALSVTRTGTDGNTTTTPTLLVQAGHETAFNAPVVKIGGCLALSGDNWCILWGDGSFSLPGGILDNTGATQGKLSIDPVHRQFVAEDGITPVGSYAGGLFTLPHLSVTGALTLSGSAAVAGFQPQFISGFPSDSSKYLRGDGSWSAIPPLTSGSNPASPALGQIYLNTSDHHFYGWNGSTWKQLDN